MSAGPATRHWRRQRASSLALLALAAWFLAGLLSLPDPGYESVRGWLSQPLQAALMLLFGWCAAWHSAQGVQVVIEDYVSDGARAAARWASRLLHLAAAAGIAWALACIARGAPA